MTSTTTTAPETAQAPTEDELLLHQFEDLDQQHDASMLAMWTFLATEVLFFGGLIMAYVVYRTIYWEAFGAAARKLNVTLGGINTVVLLTSSLTMALAVRAAQLRQRKTTVYLLIATILFGMGFLGIKAIEWHHDYELNLIPFVNFQWKDEPATPAGGHAGQTVGTAEAREVEEVTGQPTTAGARRPDWLDPELTHESGAVDLYSDQYPGSTPRASFGQRAQLFFVLYFFMTGLHAIHMIIGIVVVSIIAALVWTGWFSGCGETQVEVVGLYWHFVDIVWVFLYPLLYLIDIHQ